MGKFSQHRSGRALPAAVIAVLLVVLLAPATFIPASAVQEQDPEIQDALGDMNRYRHWLGLESMTINPSLQAAAEAHAEYYRLNFGDPNLAGMGLHMETPGLPGFTGATMRDRARAQGYEGSVNENVGLSGSMDVSLDWFMGTINHRLPIIDPRYTDVGMATVDEGEIVFEVIMFGMPQYREFAEPEWVVWPPDGTTGIGTTFWGEAPSPFPGAAYPTGVPATMSFFGEGGISLDTWSIRIDGEEISTFGSVGSGFLSGRAALITAAEPLEYGTTYTISATGVAGGEPFARTWSFTTRNEPGEDMANGAASPPDPGAAPTPTAEPSATPEAPADGSRETPPASPPVELADPGSSLPPGLQLAPPAVQELWQEMDGAVHQDLEDRSWLLGTDVWAAGPEPYAEAAGGVRDVYYFDKARVEAPSDQSHLSLQDVTAGLLVRDMILGSAQTGDNEFLEIGPAQIPVAGDPLEFNPDAPTYASLTTVATVDGEHQVPPRYGHPVADTLHRDGTIGRNESLGDATTFGSYYPATGHNIATVFEAYLAALPVDWWSVVGLPITEPYWTQVMVSGEQRWVLVQAFERRLVTFTPANDPDWRVEMGNVGQHYYSWRYGIDPPIS